MSVGWGLRSMGDGWGAEVGRWFCLGSHAFSRTKHNNTAVCFHQVVESRQCFFPSAALVKGATNATQNPFHLARIQLALYVSNLDEALHHSQRHKAMLIEIRDHPLRGPWHQGFIVALFIHIWISAVISKNAFRSIAERVHFVVIAGLLRFWKEWNVAKDVSSSSFRQD
jgi:hypothetical protein